MEALIAIFTEALAVAIGGLAGVLAPIVAAMVDVLVMLLAAAVELVVLLAARQDARPAPSPVPASPVPRPSRCWPRRLLWISGTLALIGILTVVLVQMVFARPLVERALARAQERLGMAITWRALEVDALAGRLALDDVHLLRADHPHSTCDLRVARVTVDAALWSCLWGDLHLEEVVITGMRGSLSQRLGVADPAGSRRSWTLDRLAVSDVAVEATLERDGRRFSAPCRIDGLDCAPLASRHLLFDLLLRSRLTGTIGEASLAIASRPQDQGRLTTWRAHGLPAALVAVSLGGPFSCLEDGTLDVDVDDRWSWDAPRFLHMDHRVTTRGLRLDEAWEAPGVWRTVLPAVRSWFAARNGDTDLRFRLEVDPGRFTGITSFDALDLGRSLAPAVIAAIATECGITPDQVRVLGASATGMGKELIERWRRRSRSR